LLRNRALARAGVGQLLDGASIDLILEDSAGRKVLRIGVRSGAAITAPSPIGILMAIEDSIAIDRHRRRRVKAVITVAVGT
jgi:hypothetical protein